MLLFNSEWSILKKIPVICRKTINIYLRLRTGIKENKFTTLKEFIIQQSFEQMKSLYRKMYKTTELWIQAVSIFMTSKLAVIFIAFCNWLWKDTLSKMCELKCVRLLNNWEKVNFNEIDYKNFNAQCKVFLLLLSKQLHLMNRLKI